MLEPHFVEEPNRGFANVCYRGIESSTLVLHRFDTVRRVITRQEAETMNRRRARLSRRFIHRANFYYCHVYRKLRGRNDFNIWPHPIREKSVPLSLSTSRNLHLRLIIRCRNNSVSACIEFKFDVQTFRRCHVRMTRRPNGTGAENKEISAFSGNVRVLLATGPWFRRATRVIYLRNGERGASRSARFKYAKREPVFGGDGQGVAGTARIVHNVLLKLQACRDGAFGRWCGRSYDLYTTTMALKRWDNEPRDTNDGCIRKLSPLRFAGG